MVEEIGHRFLSASSLFGAKQGAVAPLGAKEISPCALAGRELWRLLSFIKCEMGSPRPSLAGDNGTSPARFENEVWGHFCPAGAERYGLLTPGGWSEWV